MYYGIEIASTLGVKMYYDIEIPSTSEVKMYDDIEIPSVTGMGWDILSVTGIECPTPVTGRVSQLLLG